jgi:hypothetical protein
MADSSNHKENDNMERVTVTIEVFDRTYSASVDFVADGLTHERHIADAVASALAGCAATDANTSLPCLMAHIAEQYPSPEIVRTAGWAYRCSDIRDSGYDDWRIEIYGDLYQPNNEAIPGGVVSTPRHQAEGGVKEEKSPRIE